MDNSAKHSATFHKEIADIIGHLSLGPVVVAPKSQTVFELKINGANSIEVSARALAYLARKGWVKRDGTIMRITEKASSPQNVSKPEAKAFELTENGETRTVSRVVAESPIDYLASRKDKNGVALLGNAEWSAGDRLRSDFTKANMLPGIGMRWGEPIRGSGGAGGGANQTDMAMAARMRVTRAIEAVGPEFSGLLIDVCCFLKGLEQIEMERRWPQRSAKVMLRAGLSILARHYAPPAKPAAKIRNWGTDDFRPSL